jgi:Holliday junction resolvasome RuvABC endonuclease subunit
MYIREKFGGYEWVVGIEGYAMRATGRTFCIAELGGSIKRTLFDAGFPIYVIPPKAARALVFGHGGIDKEQVHDLVRRALGVDTDPRSMWTSDEADAYVVMRAVEMLHSSSERLSIPHRRLAIKLLKAHGELK